MLGHKALHFKNARVWGRGCRWTNSCAFEMEFERIHKLEHNERNAWDPFLCVNSIGIWLGFRTAFTQGLDENLRKKLQSLNLHLTRRQFVCRPSVTHNTCNIAITYFDQTKEKSTFCCRHIRAHSINLVLIASSR